MGGWAAVYLVFKGFKEFRLLIGELAAICNPGILAQFVKKQVIEMIKFCLLPATFSEIRTQNCCKLRFIQNIYQFKLRQAVQHFGGGDSKTGHPAARHKF